MIIVRDNNLYIGINEINKALPNGLAMQAKFEEARMAKDRALLVVRTGKDDYDKKIEEVEMCEEGELLSA